MSAGSVFRECLAMIRSLELPAVAERDLVACMEAARPGPLELLYEAGADAGLERAVLLRRVAACFFGYAGGSVADDLADGDCTYLEEPLKTGSCSIFIFEHLFFRTMSQTGVPIEVMSEASLQLVQAAARQHIEVRTQAWTAALFKEVAELGAGLPFSAWMRMLWHGTPLYAKAEEVGRKVGILGQTAADIRTHDPRFMTLTDTDKDEVRRWSMAVALSLQAEPMRWIAALLAATVSHLEGT